MTFKNNLKINIAIQLSKIKELLLAESGTLLHKSLKQCFSNIVPRLVFIYLSSVKTEHPGKKKKFKTFACWI